MSPLDPVLTEPLRNAQTVLSALDFAGVVRVAAGVENRERTAPEERVETTLAARQQLLDLLLRETFERAARGDPPRGS